MELQVGVKALLRNGEGKYLLLRRSKDKYPEITHDWGIPGGRIHVGETLIDALGREIKEETSLDLLTKPKLVAAQDILRQPGRHVVRLTYEAQASGDVSLSEENTEYRWATLYEIRNLDNLDLYVKAILNQIK